MIDRLTDPGRKPDILRLGDQTRIIRAPHPETELGIVELNPVVVFCGVTAVGKDYVAGELQKVIPQARLLGFGEMLSAAIGIDRSELSGLKPEDMESYYPQIVREALNTRPTLLTAHPVFRQGDTLCFNPSIYTRMNPLAFVVVTSQEDQINGWRTQREAEIGRPANCEKPRDIRIMQDVTLAILDTFAANNGAGLIEVRNTPDNLEGNIQFLDNTLRNWWGEYCDLRI